MDRLSLSLLGIPEVQYAGQPLKFATRKVLALLIYLAVEPGRHPREKLIALLWPESDLQRGQASLRNTLTRLRDALGQAERWLVVEDDRLGLSAEVELDVRTLAATVLVKAGDMLARLRQAAALYRGDFLESFSLPDAPDFE
ncbi:MAG: SARP family transcriptional regulator, partial [Acidobacteria bacterium]|nr:SARP family transcriptional regulator [Acidobacteriota bacterium]